MAFAKQLKTSEGADLNAYIAPSARIFDDANEVVNIVWGAWPSKQARADGSPFVRLGQQVVERSADAALYGLVRAAKAQEVPYALLAELQPDDDLATKLLGATEVLEVGQSPAQPLRAVQ